MKVNVYFCKEPDIETILKKDKISRQALSKIYDLVWECEFKNILNTGRVWLTFRSHYQISLGDIIQIANEFYIVEQVGARKISVVD